MKLAIGVVTSHDFPIPAEFWTSYEQLCTHLRSGQVPSELNLESFYRVKSDGFPMDVARNQIIRATLASTADQLLFLDCDHVLPETLFDRLAVHHKDVVTARYHVRYPPFHANAYVSHPLAKPGEFKTVHYGRGCFEIDRGGAGALLVTRRVLESIGEDWFRYQRNPNPPHDFSTSEDFWFYAQAQRAGFSCWCDWETEVEHLAMIPIGLFHQEGYLRLMERDLTPNMLKGLVACGFDEPLEIVPGLFVEPHIGRHVVQTRPPPRVFEKEIA